MWMNASRILIIAMAMRIVPILMMVSTVPVFLATLAMELTAKVEPLN